MDPRAELEQLRKLKRLKELEAKAGGAQPQAASPQPAMQPEPQSWDSNIPSWVKDAASMYNAYQGKLIKGASLGYLDPKDLPVLGKGYEKSYQESPISAGLGQAVGAVGPSMVAGAGVARLIGTPASALGRIALNTGTSAGEGFVRKPEENETRLGNAANQAKYAAGFSTAAEGIAKGAQYGSKALSWLGRKFAGLSPQEAEAFMKDPANAEEILRMQRDDPEGLSNLVRSKIGGGIEEAFDTSSQPSLDRLGKAVAQKRVAVNPEQYQGSEVGKEIDRAWALQNPNRVAQVQEISPYEVKSTPIQETMSFGHPEKQRVFSDYDPYHTPEVQVQSVERGFAPTGPEQTISRGFTKGPISEIPTQPKQVPDKFALEGPQALRAIRNAQKAAAYKEALNPLAYNAADDIEASAAANLNKGLKAVSPEAAAEKDLLSKSARYAGVARARFSNNPAAILTDSESLGSIPTRAMRQHLDAYGNAGLQDMSDALAAARKLSAPKEPEKLREFIKRFSANKALGASSGLKDSADQISRDIALKTYLSSLLGK